MGNDPVPQFIVAFVALILSGFFTLLKYAYEDLNKFKFERMEEEEKITDREKKELVKILDSINEIQSTFMISDYLSNAFVAASTASIGYHYGSNSGLILGVIIGTILIVVFGESAPYFISLTKGEDIALSLVNFTKIYTRIFSPLVILVRFFARGIGSLFGLEKDYKEPKITEDELFTAMNLSKDEGLLDLEEFGMIEKVFDFSDTFVKDVMTPRTDVVAIDIESSIDEILEIFNEEGYSRIPIYEDDIDNLLGILHVKDLLPHFINGQNLSIRNSLRKPIYSFEYQKTSDLFKLMRRNNGTFAVVLDEYGGTDGIVTMEDLIEEIVGEIEDEYDDADLDRDIIPLKNNMYILDGSARLEDISKRANLDLESDEVDTIAGFVFEKFDRIPEQGEVLEYENLVITVLGLEKNRISKLKLQVK